MPTPDEYYLSRLRLEASKEYGSMHDPLKGSESWQDLLKKHPLCTEKMPAGLRNGSVIRRRYQRKKYVELSLFIKQSVNAAEFNVAISRLHI